MCTCLSYTAYVRQANLSLDAFALDCGLISISIPSNR